MAAGLLRRISAAIVLSSFLAGVAPAAPATPEKPLPANPGVTTPAPNRAATSLSHRVKERQRQLMMQKARSFFAKAKAAKRKAKTERRAKGATPPAATAAKHAYPPDGPPPRPAWKSAATRHGFETSAVTGLGADVLVNDTTAAESDAGAGQGEPSIAAWGTNVLIAWNDGWGFETLGDLQGFGYSLDGGVTFHDGGDIPKPPNSFWTSDPVITVNEKTGEFYYIGLIEPSATTNGIGVVRATFSGSGVVWDTPQIITQGSNTSVFFDKPWAVADSATGRLYLVNTRFFVGGNLIEFRRTTGNWKSWSAGIEISDPTGRGFLQGPRVAVGPAGEVYTVWKEVGDVDFDFFQFRSSLNQGLTFNPQVTATNMLDNFGTGAPGFNRERGIGFPAIAVDRTSGPYRGRVYLAWNECLNFWRDLYEIDNTGPPLGLLSEVENNNSTLSAQPFTPGQRIIASFSAIDIDPAPPDNGDVDFYKFDATAGTSYTFVCDSIEASLYSMRVICSDTTTRLNLAGDLSYSPADPIPSLGFITWTCPATGTYYLRLFPNIPDSQPGQYTVWTMQNTTGPEPGRDQRDVMTVFSTDRGVNWSAPNLVNDDPPLYDDWLPEIAVAGSGQVFTFWYDWRDADPLSCGGESNMYLGRSDDGGNSWTNVGAVSDQTSAWTFTFSNITPNQGDYLAMYADGIAVYTCWADGRFGNPDVFAASIPLDVTPALVSLAGADADIDQVTIRWYSASPRVTEAYVYRLEDGEWYLQGAVTRDLEGRFQWVDRDVRPGVRYAYRLGVRQGDREIYMGEVSVVVPTRSALALSGISPNPTDRDVWVTFTLPLPGSASLSMWDVSGRRVAQREVGAMGVGRHVVNLAEGMTLAPGVYVVRLEQAGKLATQRVSVVR